jgi:hypothetical protein
MKAPKEVDKIFVGQPLDPRGGGLYPLGPLRPPRPSWYFGLPIMNPSHHYHQIGLIIIHLTILSTWRILTQLLICLVLPLVIQCIIGVTIIWEITQIIRRMEIYYKRLLKLTNNLQHKTTNNFLTIIFRSGLQPYLHVTTIGMKRKSL